MDVSLIELSIRGKDEDSEVGSPFNIGLPRALSRKIFLGNNKEEEGESNENKLFWGIAGGGGHVDEH